uniref:Nucleobindin-2-like n=1 Tax=Saccoglossus kowalevskii TaxID=10224 RepID=A0ABM0LVH0_SACKO|nr:PREDICTED: nucleobindin-2-like [Saccoglossus kowalevskii]
MIKLKQCLPWLLLAAAISMVYSAPVDINEDELTDEDLADSHLLLEYQRYYSQVGEILTDDPKVMEELDKLSNQEIIDGNVSHILKFAHKTVRDKLDELKTREIKRLRKAKQDIDRIDKMRKEEFKKGAMEKEIQRRKELLNLTSNERKVQEEKFAEEKLKEGKHEKVNHPGSKKQFQEVWEKTDHLEKDYFNPKVFFTIHDVNGDGFLDMHEMEALLILEVEKIYGKDGNPVEIKEELSRMREHIYNQSDKNKDNLISKKEFLESLVEDQDEEGWEDLRDNPIYTEDELNAYKKKMEVLQEQVKANVKRLKQERKNKNMAEKVDDNVVKMEV